MLGALARIAAAGLLFHCLSLSPSRTHPRRRPLFTSSPSRNLHLRLFSSHSRSKPLGLRINFRVLCNLPNLYLITNELRTTYPRTVRSGGRKIIQIACGWWRREFKLIFELVRWVRWVLHWRMCYIVKISQSSLSCPLLSQS